MRARGVRDALEAAAVEPHGLAARALVTSHALLTQQAIGGESARNLLGTRQIEIEAAQGEALAQAHKAVEGDIAGVTQSLGVAFNSTFIALLISIVVMFVLHQLQQAQERVVLDTQTYLDRQLIRHMQTR